MDKIFDYIWWIMTVMLIPLDASCIIYYIVEENFNSTFWLLVVAFISLACSLGIRLCIMENRKGK